MCAELNEEGLRREPPWPEVRSRAWAGYAVVRNCPSGEKMAGTLSSRDKEVFWAAAGNRSLRNGTLSLQPLL